MSFPGLNGVQTVSWGFTALVCQYANIMQIMFSDSPVNAGLQGGLSRLSLLPLSESIVIICIIILARA